MAEKRQNREVDVGGDDSTVEGVEMTEVPVNPIVKAAGGDRVRASCARGEVCGAVSHTLL